MLEGQIEALKSMGSNTPQYSLLEEINNYSSNLTEDEKKLIEKSPLNILRQRIPSSQGL